MKPFEKKNICH